MEKLDFTVRTANVREDKNGKLHVIQKAKCKIVFADCHDNIENVLKEVCKILKYYGLKTYTLDTNGFLAIAMGSDFTKLDAERELEKHRAKD